jgi:plasmid stability protein
MAAMKRIVVDLDGGEYQRLRQRAQDEDRDAHQESRHIVRQVLQEEPQRRVSAAWLGKWVEQHEPAHAEESPCDR